MNAVAYTILLPLALLAGALFSVWRVRVHRHAAVRHGDEADEARGCLDTYGEWQTWREPSGRYHRLCKTPGGAIYDQVVEWTGEHWEEITAFKPNPHGVGNTWNNIRAWLERKGATPYKGKLPPPTK